MGKRSLVLIIALALAAVSAFAVWQYLTTVEDEARAEVQEVVVYRATQLIQTGTSVAEAEAFIEESTALVEAVAFEGSQIVCDGPAENSDAPLDICGPNPRLDSVLDPANVAAGPISAGQLITSDMFVLPSQLSDVKLSESIPQGKVAISFRVGDDATVGGFVRPGDRVNLETDILGGQRGPKRDMVLLNAASAFVAAGRDGDFKAAIQRAATTIDSGSAQQKLDSLVEFTQQFAG